jgi:glyoxylase-like metal-dependent hydrolase (beta-lactamase superfamily II)
MTLDGAPLSEDALRDAELAVLPQPGHTAGSMCLLYRGRFLFTGDHIAYSRRLGHIVAFRLQCWNDWERQTRSVRDLAALAEAGHLRFSWILPGHGEWHHFEGDGGAAATATALRSAVEWMERQPPGRVPLARYIPFAQSRMNPRSGLARVVRAISGAGPGRDTWILPPGARAAVPDYDPRKNDAAVRRAYMLGAGALALVAGMVWLTARA